MSGMITKKERVELGPLCGLSKGDILGFNHRVTCQRATRRIDRLGDERTTAGEQQIPRGGVLGVGICRSKKPGFRTIERTEIEARCAVRTRRNQEDELMATRKKLRPRVAVVPQIGVQGHQ